MSQKNSERPIEEYLSLIGSLLIDQFNERYKNFSNEQFKKEADERFVEKDWVYKIGDFFKDLAYYEAGENKKGQGHNDISIPSKNFIMEIKYARNFTASSGNKTGSTTWDQYKNDFDWLEESLKDKKLKGKRAFIIIWCNSVDYLGRIIQLGNKRSPQPEVAPDKIVYFPFLMCNPAENGKTYTKDTTYNYDKSKYDVNFNTVGRSGGFDCIFLGKENDRIHMAIYY